MQFKAVGGVRINVAVLAYDDKVLWDCRNFLYDFIDKTNYNLGITLTKDSSVIFHGMKFVPGGLDLILVSDHYMKNLSKPLPRLSITQKFSFWERNKKMRK